VRGVQREEYRGRSTEGRVQWEEYRGRSKEGRVQRKYRG